MPGQTTRVQTVIDAVMRKVFSHKLIVNHMRGTVVEAIVAAALGSAWTWCSEDWGGWDFDRADGLRLEVKQSAARQTWSAANAKPSRASFDIAARKGRYAEESAWIDGPGRWADLYVFAHHPILDLTADHRDPQQWVFHVVPATSLPHQGSIALSGVRALAPSCRYEDLSAEVAKVAEIISR